MSAAEENYYRALAEGFLGFCVMWGLFWVACIIVGERKGVIWHGVAAGVLGPIGLLIMVFWRDEWRAEIKSMHKERMAQGARLEALHKDQIEKLARLGDGLGDLAMVTKAAGGLIDVTVEGNRRAMGFREIQAAVHSGGMSLYTDYFLDGGVWKRLADLPGLTVV